MNRIKLKIALLVAFICAPIVAVIAQVPPSPSNPGCTYRSAVPTLTANQAINILCDVNGNLNVSVTSRSATSTEISGTVTTLNVFQALLAANTARKGCLIQNPSSNTATIYIALKAFGSASVATSYTISPGGTFSCVAAGMVISDILSISASASATPFVAYWQ